MFVVDKNQNNYEKKNKKVKFFSIINICYVVFLQNGKGKNMRFLGMNFTPPNQKRLMALGIENAVFLVIIFFLLKTNLIGFADFGAMALGFLVATVLFSCGLSFKDHTFKVIGLVLASSFLSWYGFQFVVGLF